MIVLITKKYPVTSVLLDLIELILPEKILTSDKETLKRFLLLELILLHHRKISPEKELENL